MPGCGFGGSCFPKDVQAIGAMGKSLGVKTHMMDGIVKTNARQPSQVSKYFINMSVVLKIRPLVYWFSFQTAGQMMYVSLLQSRLPRN